MPLKLITHKKQWRTHHKQDGKLQERFHYIYGNAPIRSDTLHSFARVIMCYVSKFNNTNNFIILYLRILLGGFFPFSCRFLRLFVHCMRKRELVIVKCIKWPHDSLLEYHLNWFLCCFVSFRFGVDVIIIIIVMTSHSAHPKPFMVAVCNRFYYSALLSFFSRSLSLFLRSLYCHFIAAILFSLLTFF